MEEIKAYKCEYCGKLYSEKKSCQNHEKRCYHNPETRSCMSCAYLIKEQVPIGTRHLVEFKTCGMNVDLSTKLKNNCDLHTVIEEDEENDFIITLPKTDYYDRALAIERYVNTHSDLISQLLSSSSNN